MLAARELIGLAVLAIAAAIGLSFALADPQPKASAPTTRATAIPRTPNENETVTIGALTGESPWRIAFFQLDGAGNADLVSGSELEELDLTFTAEPLPELKGSPWRVAAQMTFRGPPGTYDIKLQYRGSAVIRADAQDLARSASPNRTRLLRATFEKDEADMVIQVELEGAAEGGVARWQLTIR